VLTGVKLLVVGVVASVAWPLAFLYPIYKLSLSLLQLLHGWEHNKRLNPQSLFELAQMLVMLYAVSRLVAILSIYSSVGYSSCLLGAVLLGVSINPSLIKQGCAVLAPYMVQVDRALEHADVFVNYDKLMRVLTASSPFVPSTTTHSQSSVAQYSSVRVEELHEETVMIPTARAATVGASIEASSDSYEDDDAAMIEEFNIDHFDCGVIDLTTEQADDSFCNTSRYSYGSSNQHIRLRRKSSLCSSL